MNIRLCNQKLIFGKDCGIDFSIWLCKGYALYERHAILGISSLQPDTKKITTLPPTGCKKVTFQHFSRYQKPNFRYKRNKKFVLL